MTTGDIIALILFSAMAIFYVLYLMYEKRKLKRQKEAEYKDPWEYEYRDELLKVEAAGIDKMATELNDRAYKLEELGMYLKVIDALRDENTDVKLVIKPETIDFRRSDYRMEVPETIRYIAEKEIFKKVNEIKKSLNLTK